MHATAMARHEEVYRHFYRIVRCGANTLSDGGGPFGFDIQAALMIDHLVCANGCDGIFETGCHMGDTTAYLADMYSQTPIITCDVDATNANFTATRLRSKANVEVHLTDSREMLQRSISRFDRPFVYLDAHASGHEWPLQAELELVQRGVVCIDDFNVGYPHFAYDRYDGVECGPRMLAPHVNRLSHYYVQNPEAKFPLPCLQVRRRGGKAFLEFDLGHDSMSHCEWFERREN